MKESTSGDCQNTEIRECGVLIAVVCDDETMV